jgi:GDPmannose 4,6-dehydratase
VTRKISNGIARIRSGQKEVLELGNLSAKRDWGFAREYVDGMWRMLQAPEPDVYVLATGRNATVRDFVTLACKAAGINIVWEGAEEKERGLDSATGKVIVRVNPRYYRPAEVDNLIGNAEKAKLQLGWQAKTTLEELCQMMVSADIKRVTSGSSSSM